MSWQSVMLNAALRILCKRRVASVPFPVARSRFVDLLEMGSRAVGLPRQVRRQGVLVGGVPCDWIIAKESQSARRVLVYFHGGAFMAGSPRTHRDVAWRLSRACHAKVLLVDYRLTPDHAHPAPIEDALRVFTALVETGHLARSIAFVGDSAGANIALVTILKLCACSTALPGACVCLSPWVDLTHSSPVVRNNVEKESMLPLSILMNAARSYAGDTSLSDPAVSPLFADFHGFPPLLIYAARDELLVDDAVRLAERARSHGVPTTLRLCAGQAHAFPTFAAFVPEARRAVADIGEFIRVNLSERKLPFIMAPPLTAHDESFTPHTH